MSGEPRGLATDSALVRLVREALSIVARHASASRVVVSLDYLDDEELLNVRDYGIGFSTTCTEGPTESGGCVVSGVVPG